MRWDKSMYFKKCLGNIIQVPLVTEDVCGNISFVYYKNVLPLRQSCRHLPY